jgi:hypothetical protein
MEVWIGLGCGFEAARVAECEGIVAANFGQ